jgi:ribosome-associated protein
MTTAELTTKIVSILDNKKAIEIEAIEIADLTVLADVFIIATGTSSTHVNALADEVDYELKQAGILPNRIEGNRTSWILMDYGAVVLHIFQQDSREFYNLEEMWESGKQLDLSDIITPEES